jgi:hypothetical protein
MFQMFSNFLGFRFKCILIKFKQRFKSFLEIETNEFVNSNKILKERDL